MRITDTVYNSIKTAIIKHDLSPGSHLSVPALAEKLELVGALSGSCSKINC